MSSPDSLTVPGQPPEPDSFSPPSKRHPKMEKVPKAVSTKNLTKMFSPLGMKKAAIGDDHKKKLISFQKSKHDSSSMSLESHTLFSPKFPANIGTSPPKQGSSEYSDDAEAVPEQKPKSALENFYESNVEYTQIGSLSGQQFQRVWKIEFDNTHNLVYLAVAKIKLETHSLSIVQQNSHRNLDIIRAEDVDAVQDEQTVGFELSLHVWELDNFLPTSLQQALAKKVYISKQLNFPRAFSPREIILQLTNEFSVFSEIRCQEEGAQVINQDCQIASYSPCSNKFKIRTLPIKFSSLPKGLFFTQGQQVELLSFHYEAKSPHESRSGTTSNLGGLGEDRTREGFFKFVTFSEHLLKALDETIAISNNALLKYYDQSEEDLLSPIQFFQRKQKLLVLFPTGLLVQVCTQRAEKDYSIQLSLDPDAPITKASFVQDEVFWMLDSKQKLWKATSVNSRWEAQRMSTLTNSESPLFCSVSWWASDLVLKRLVGLDTSGYLELVSKCRADGQKAVAIFQHGIPEEKLARQFIVRVFQVQKKPCQFILSRKQWEPLQPEEAMQKMEFKFHMTPQSPENNLKKKIVSDAITSIQFVQRVKDASYYGLTVDDGPWEVFLLQKKSKVELLFSNGRTFKAATIDHSEQNLQINEVRMNEDKQIFVIIFGKRYNQKFISLQRNPISNKIDLALKQPEASAGGASLQTVVFEKGYLIKTLTIKVSQNTTRPQVSNQAFDLLLILPRDLAPRELFDEERCSSPIQVNFSSQLVGFDKTLIVLSQDLNHIVNVGCLVVKRNHTSFLSLLDPDSKAKIERLPSSSLLEFRKGSMDTSCTIRGWSYFLVHKETSQIVRLNCSTLQCEVLIAIKEDIQELNVFPDSQEIQMESKQLWEDLPTSKAVRLGFLVKQANVVKLWLGNDPIGEEDKRFELSGVLSLYTRDQSFESDLSFEFAAPDQVLISSAKSNFALVNISPEGLKEKAGFRWTTLMVQPSLGASLVLGAYSFARLNEISEQVQEMELASLPALSLAMKGQQQALNELLSREELEGKSLFSQNPLSYEFSIQPAQGVLSLRKLFLSKPEVPEHCIPDLEGYSAFDLAVDENHVSWIQEFFTSLDLSNEKLKGSLTKAFLQLLRVAPLNVIDSEFFFPFLPLKHRLFSSLKEKQIEGCRELHSQIQEVFPDVNSKSGGQRTEITLRVVELALMGQGNPKSIVTTLANSAPEVLACQVVQTIIDFKWNSYGRPLSASCLIGAITYGMLALWFYPELIYGAVGVILASQTVLLLNRVTSGFRIIIAICALISTGLAAAEHFLGVTLFGLQCAMVAWALTVLDLLGQIPSFQQFKEATWQAFTKSIVTTSCFLLCLFVAAMANQTTIESYPDWEGLPLSDWELTLGLALVFSLLLLLWQSPLPSVDEGKTKVGFLAAVEAFIPNKLLAWLMPNYLIVMEPLGRQQTFKTDHGVQIKDLDLLGTKFEASMGTQQEIVELGMKRNFAALELKLNSMQTQLEIVAKEIYHPIRTTLPALSISQIDKPPEVESQNEPAQEDDKTYRKRLKLFRQKTENQLVPSAKKLEQPTPNQLQVPSPKSPITDMVMTKKIEEEEREEKDSKEIKAIGSDLKLMKVRFENEISEVRRENSELKAALLQSQQTQSEVLAKLDSLEQESEQRRAEQNQINGVILGQIQNLALLIKNIPSQAPAPQQPEFSNIVCESMNINPVMAPRVPDFDMSKIKNVISKSQRTKRVSKKEPALKVNNFTAEEEVSMALQSLPILKLKDQKIQEERVSSPKKRKKRR